MKNSVSKRASRLGASLGLGLVLLAAMTASASAQSVTTTPVGAMTYTVPATGASSATTLFTAPLLNSPTYSGAITGVTATTVTFAGTPFTSGGLVVAGAPYFARIISGAQAGRTILITANDASTITLDTTDNSSQTTSLLASAFSVAAGDKVQIIAGDTLATFFGDNTSGNPVAVTAGTSVLNADTINIYNKNTGKSDLYFFSTATSAWRASNSAANKNSVILYPENAFGITHVASAGSFTFTVAGQVPSVAPLVKVTGSGSTIQSGTSYPTDLTLAQIVIPNWTKGTNVLNADTISVFNSSTGKFEIYLQRSSDSLWIKSGGGTTDRSATVIPAGSSYRISKLAAVSDATSFVSIPLPYSL
jgi:uncharacterized protein (TIGR02597 family)